MLPKSDAHCEDWFLLLFQFVSLCFSPGAKSFYSLPTAANLISLVYDTSKYMYHP